MSINFATFSDLKRYTNELALDERLVMKSLASRTDNKDTFLSHSSKDSEYLPGVIKLLKNHGASVYCDLDDERMPSSPTPETGQIIKGQIKRSKRLVLFVTTNSKDSKWVPWELGIGDSALSSDSVALLPVSASAHEQSWAKQEYLGLYRHIVFGTMVGEPKPLWMVFDHRTNIATKLGNWCRGV